MKFRYIVILLLLFSTHTLFAIDPHEVIDKPFSFIHLYTNNWGLHDDIKLDCFYNYTSTIPISKQLTKKNRYYIQGKYTSPDSIYNHRFVGASFTNEPKKGSYLIMKDDKGDSLLMSLPKFNPTKEFDSDKKLYSHKNVKTVGRYSNKNTFIDLTVVDLSQSEAYLDTINMCSHYYHLNPTIPFPNYKVTSYSIDDIGEPTVTILINDTIVKKWHDADLARESRNISHLLSKVSVLETYIESADSSILAYWKSKIGEEIWINECYLNNSNSKAVTYFPSSIKPDYNYLLPDWLESRFLSSAALGGPTYKFYHIKIDSIVVLPNINYEIDNHNQLLSRSKPLPEMPDSCYFQYYLKVSPFAKDTERLQRLGIYPISKSSDKEFLIPINFNLSPRAYTDSELDAIVDGFYQNEQVEWTKFNEEQQAYYNIATRAWGEDIAKIVCRGEVRLGFDEDMCHFAFMRTPYKTANKQTPLGWAECQDFYMEGVKLYFQNKILIGIEWRGNTLFEPRHRY